VHENETVTSVLFQPLAFAAGARSPEISGATRSMLTSLIVADALLPALSVTVNVWL